MRAKFDKESSCEGKDTYATKAEASMAAARLVEKGNVRISMIGYACLYCGKYHIGHSTKTKSLKRVDKRRRDKKKLNPLDYDVHPGLKEGYCIIKKAM